MCRQTLHLASAKSATGVAFDATSLLQLGFTWFLTDIPVGPPIKSDNKRRIVVQCIMDDSLGAIG
jgi:hypothetical protein